MIFLHYNGFKHPNSKRILAIILSVILFLTTVFSVSVITSSAASFSPRLYAPAYDNTYYYGSKNIFYTAGYGMPNCTAYAFGRAYEILGTEPNLSHGNAEDWYGYNKATGAYDYGSTPKVGAIACWSHYGGGHVAVVESISNGTVTMSNSAWSGTNFYLTYGSVSNPGAAGNSWWNFQGFIYILDSNDSGDNDSGIDIPNKSTDDYSTGIYKVTVDSTLNMRSGVGSGTSWVASIPDGTELNITDIDSDSSYVWGYTNYNGNSGWVALDFCKYIGSEPEVTEPEVTEPEITEPEATEPEVTEPEATEPETTTPAPTRPEKSDTDPVNSNEQSGTDAQEPNDEPNVTNPPEGSTEYVLYFAYDDSEETGVYPLESKDQEVTVTLKAGKYSIFMKGNDEVISSTYPLTLEQTSEVSVTFYSENDYFDIHVNELNLPPTNEEIQDNAQSTPDTAETTVSPSVSQSTSDTVANNNTTVSNTNGTVQTGSNIRIEAVALLVFSVSSLILLWIKRKVFFF